MSGSDEARLQIPPHEPRWAPNGGLPMTGSGKAYEAGTGRQAGTGKHARTELNSVPNRSPDARWVGHLCQR